MNAGEFTDSINGPGNQLRKTFSCGFGGVRVSISMDIKDEESLGRRSLLFDEADSNQMVGPLSTPNMQFAPCRFARVLGRVTQ